MIFPIFNVKLIFNILDRVQDEVQGLLFICLMILLLFIAALITIIVQGYLDKCKFKVTSYKIYNNKIDLEELFINHKHSSILFKDIKEIHLDQNFIQKKYNIATIRFITAANNLEGETSIRFQDIENARFVYAKAKEILNK